jgi:hypothetical protein
VYPEIGEDHRPEGFYLTNREDIEERAAHAEKSIGKRKR